MVRRKILPELSGTSCFGINIHFHLTTTRGHFEHMIVIGADVMCVYVSLSTCEFMSVV